MSIKMINYHFQQHRQNLLLWEVQDLQIMVTFLRDIKIFYK